MKESFLPKLTFQFSKSGILPSPVTQLTQSANRQNGEFEAGHTRNGGIKETMIYQD
ncbi:hypothetical protein NQ549_12085 [[Eubacterium] siraeum]|nr:hypothetical protein NQ549_12085 [[Eubacterium] siraeum]